MYSLDLHRDIHIKCRLLGNVDDISNRKIIKFLYKDK